MRPNLFELPGNWLYVAALLLAVGIFVRNLVQRRRDPSVRWSTTPLILVAATAWLGGWAVGHPVAFGELGLPRCSTALTEHCWKALPIYSYGVMLGSSLLVGWFLAMKLAKNDGIAPEAAGAIYMWTAVSSIIGARLLYILTNWDEFHNPLDILMLNKGGLVAYGGMIGGFLGSVYTCWRRKIQLLRWADAAAPSVVLGTAITRVGCLLYGCDYGAVTNVPWAISFPATYADHPEMHSPAWTHHVHDLGLSSTAASSLPVHPTQIYESLVGLTLFGLLMLIRRYRKLSGLVFLAWVLGYGLMRPIIEVFRDDDQRGSVGPLSTSQLIGIATFVLGVAFLIALLKKYRADPAALRLWELPPVGAAAAPAAAAQPTAPARGSRRHRRRR